MTQTELGLLARAAPTFFGHANTAALRAHFPRSPRAERFASCAVVGSAGHLGGAGLGAEIDRHAAVIRINDAPAGGAFELDVGARTTHRFVHAAPRVLAFLDARGGAPLGETLFWFLWNAKGLQAPPNPSPFSIYRTLPALYNVCEAPACRADGPSDAREGPCRATSNRRPRPAASSSLSRGCSRSLPRRDPPPEGRPPPHRRPAPG